MNAPCFVLGGNLPGQILLQIANIRKQYTCLVLGTLHLTYSVPFISFSLEECGRYLETIKVYENKPADTIREQTDTDYMSRVNSPLH